MCHKFIFLLLSVGLTTGATLFSAANASPNASRRRTAGLSENDIIELQGVKSVISSLKRISNQLQTNLLHNSENLQPGDLIKVELMINRIKTIQEDLTPMTNYVGSNYLIGRRGDALNRIKKLGRDWGELVPTKTAPNNPVYKLLRDLYELWRHAPALSPE